MALAGLLMVVCAPGLAVALLGFLLIGFGVCASYPLTSSAAARLGDRPSSQNVAALTLATQVALIATPAILGFVAQHLGIRAVFMTVGPFVAAALWFARYLEPRQTHKLAQGREYS
jgi:MFS family permease